MNKFKIISTIFFLYFVFVNNSNGQALSNTQTEIIKIKVDSVFQEMLTNAENLDFDKLNSGVNDNHKVGFISNGKYYEDYSALIKDVKLTAQGLNHQNISIKNKKITVLSDNVAILTSSGIASAKINDGRVISANILWSFVFEKTDNNWEVIYSHQSIAN